MIQVWSNFKSNTPENWINWHAQIKQIMFCMFHSFSKRILDLNQTFSQFATFQGLLTTSKLTNISSAHFVSNWFIILNQPMCLELLSFRKKCNFSTETQDPKNYETFCESSEFSNVVFVLFFVCFGIGLSALAEFLKIFCK